MFIFDLDNFLVLYLNQNGVYLGILLYFNWLEEYLRVLAGLQKKYLKDEHKIDKNYKICKTIRAPPNSELV